MAKAYCFVACLLGAYSAAAHAGDGRFSVETEYTDYSGAFGSRRETSAQASTDLGATTFVLKGSQARRTFDDKSASAVRAAGTMYHDWSDRFFTRTMVGISSNKPLFASREISNDFNYKVVPNAVVTVGGRYAHYGKDTDVLAWSAGGSWYFGRGFVTYRYGSYDVDTLGKSHGHMGTIRIADGKGAGYTQLWAGRGTSLIETDPLLATRHGRFKNLTIQRIQPLNGEVALNLKVGRTWYDSDLNNYKGTTGSVGVTYTGWKLF